MKVWKRCPQFKTAYTVIIFYDTWHVRLGLTLMWWALASKQLTEYKCRKESLSKSSTYCQERQRMGFTGSSCFAYRRLINIITLSSGSYSYPKGPTFLAQQPGFYPSNDKNNVAPSLTHRTKERRACLKSCWFIYFMNSHMAMCYLKYTLLKVILVSFLFIWCIS